MSRTEIRSRTILTLIGAVTFVQALGFDFVNRDDGSHVLDNPLVIGGGNSIWEYLFTPGLGYPAATAVLTYRVIFLLFGASAWAFHLVNIVVHLVNMNLVFSIAGRFGLGTLACVLSALFFGLHPINAESVVWISNLKTLYSTFFVLLMVGEFLKSDFDWREKRFYIYFLLALFSKPTSVFIVPVLLFYEIFFRRKALREVLLPLGALSCAALLLIVLSIQMQSANDVTIPITSWIGWLRNIWYSLGFHLGLISFIQTPLPIHLTSSPLVFDPWVDLTPVVWLFVGGLFFWTARTNRKNVVFYLIWILCALLPGLGLIPIKRFLADTFCYQPVIGIAWMLGDRFERLSNDWTDLRRKIIWSGCMSVVLILMTIQTLNKSIDFRNGVDLFGAIERVFPGNSDICLRLGHAYLKWRQPEKALAQYQKCSQKFKETDAALPFEATVLEHLGRYKEARQIFLILAKTHPENQIFLREVELLNEKLK